MGRSCTLRISYCAGRSSSSCHCGGPLLSVALLGCATGGYSVHPFFRCLGDILYYICVLVSFPLTGSISTFSVKFSV